MKKLLHLSLLGISFSLMSMETEKTADKRAIDAFVELAKTFTSSGTYFNLLLDTFTNSMVKILDNDSELAKVQEKLSLIRSLSNEKKEDYIHDLLITMFCFQPKEKKSKEKSWDSPCYERLVKNTIK